MKKAIFIFITLFISFIASAQISRTVDEFTGEVRIESNTNPCIIKYINGSTTRYYLYTYTNDSYCTVGGEEIIFLFEDGTKLSKGGDVDCDVSYNYDGFTYSSFVVLTENDVNLLATKKLTKFKMYIFPREISETMSNKILTSAKQILTKK